MRRLWRSALMCLFAGWSTAAWAQPAQSDQEILIQLEHEWNAAIHRNDAAFVERFLDDDFIATYEDGTRADKQRELELIANFNQQVDSSTLEDFVVRIYGDTAVVWFTLRMVGPIQGKPVELAYRYMDVWVLRDGQWKCVGSQSTRLVPKSR